MADNDLRTTLRAIVRVKIENFQSHTDSDFTLTQGVNIIVGSSDSGKSAILRAINFVLHNLPARGTTFVRRGEKEAKVTLWFEDGTIVSRVKGPSTNAVFVTLPDGTHTPYENFGIDLPQEVIKALGNPPIDKYHGPISYADQMAPLFLVHLSPTDLPRCISQLIGTSDYEIAIKALTSNARSLEKQFKENQDRVTKADEQLAQYDDLDERIEAFNLAKATSEEVETISKDLSAGDILIEQHSTIMKEGLGIKAKLLQSKSIVDLKPSVSSGYQEVKDIKAGLAWIDESHHLDDLGHVATAYLNLVPTVITDKFKDRCASFKDMIGDLLSGLELIESYGGVVESIENTNSKLLASEKSLTELVAERDLAMKLLIEAGAVCEACGSFLNPGK